MRTPFLRDFLANISGINREIRCSDFVCAQFLADHSAAIAANPNAMTGDVFPKNVFSKRFYFQMRKVPHEVEAMRAAGRQTTLVVNYSLIEIYERELIAFSEAVLGRRFQQGDDETRFEAFRRLLNDPAHWLAGEEIHTLNFLRLRRNCIVHPGGTAGEALKELQRQKGTTLNRYWRSRRRLKALDFRLSSASAIEIEELVDCFNVSRTVITNLDGMVCASLPIKAIVREVTKRFKCECKIQGLRERKVLRKLKAFALREYKLTI